MGNSTVGAQKLKVLLVANPTCSGSPRSPHWAQFEAHTGSYSRLLTPHVPRGCCGQAGEARQPLPFLTPRKGNCRDPTEPQAAVRSPDLPFSGPSTLELPAAFGACELTGCPAGQPHHRLPCPQGQDTGPPRLSFAGCRRRGTGREAAALPPLSPEPLSWPRRSREQAAALPGTRTSGRRGVQPSAQQALEISGSQISLPLFVPLSISSFDQNPWTLKWLLT